MTRFWLVASWRWLTIGLLLLTGCSTGFYRRQADRQAQALVDQKSAAAGGVPGHYQIHLDPRSRMYDPHNPDREPMPPDDPASHRYLQCVDHKRGSACWRRLPKTDFVENPGWLEHLPWNAAGQVVLDLPGAVQLARLESPQYQNQLEELYLSALDVSFERFRFDTQFFGGSSIFATVDGNERSGTGESSSLLRVSPLSPTNRLRASRLTATGGELVVGLANSLVWQFAGPDDYSGTTLLDFSLVQPLLRAGGRTRVLERLTISERTLLANVRQLERFRRGFYLQVVTGRPAGPGPSRRGGFFGDSGLEGFRGVGGGGFGRVGLGANNFAGGVGSTGGAGAQRAGGYLGLLQTAQVLRHQRANVLALRDSVAQLQASYEAGRIDRFQVDLARQALYNAQSQLISSAADYESLLDNFKVDIGLPPELDVAISDPLLDQFQLLDPALAALQQDLADTLDTLRQRRAERAVAAVEPMLPAPTAGPRPVLLTPTWRTRVEERLAVVEDDYQKLQDARPRRRQQLAALAQRPEVQSAQLDPRLFRDAHFRERLATIDRQRSALLQHVTQTLDQLDPLEEADSLGQSKHIDQRIRVLSQLSGQLLELSLLQASVRLETIQFQPVDISPSQALAIASAYRRDWKNARANLVDAWRLIYFNANDLRSGLNVVFSGDLGNVGDNPLRLRGRNGRLRLGLEFDAPLTRLAERNLYRQSLIEYQQARRDYYQLRDRIYQGLRSTLRQVRLNEVNFELRRAAVHVAISQVDLTQLRLSEPPQPGETSQFGNTTARDLVQSLGDLLNVQNDFLSVWVNYEVQRLNLDLDLGIMEITPDGQRVENDIPLTAYLVDLPVNTTDLGLLDSDCLESHGNTPGAFDPELILLPSAAATARESAEPGDLPEQTVSPPAPIMNLHFKTHQSP